MIRKRISLTACVIVCLLISATHTVHAADGWSALPIPAAVEMPAEGGYVWYRCYVKVPDRWVLKQRKTLWVESVTLTIEGVSGAYEVYVNGTKVGGAGTLGPEYEPNEAAVRRHKVPPGVLKQGVHNTIALRVYGRGDNVGVTGAAPVLAGYYLEAVLRGDWEGRRGDDKSWAIGPAEQRPATAVFDEFREASTALKRPAEFFHGDRLPPGESLAKMRAAEDLVVEQVLTEPLVAQPIFMDFDARGRLWVVQYRQYPYPAGVEMVSRDKYYRAVYDRVPPAPGQDGYVPGADRISIHEDTDGDGRFDKHKTFIDDLNMCTAVAQGDGGVWVLNPPYLLFYADADRDDTPDGDPVVHLQGFGLEDTHSVVNSLSWGPDGWLYGAQGSTTSSRVKRPGIDAADDPGVYTESAAIWRYHPPTRRYEVFAHGGGNAFALEIDNGGRIFSGYNGGGTRGFHYMQGGYYLKGNTAKYGPPPNPYAFGTLPAIEHGNDVPRFTHGFVRYEDNALPPRYRGKLLCIDPLASNIVLSDFQSHGSTYRGKDVGTPLRSDDQAFRPVAIAVGPDGAVYVADFYEHYIAHGQHFQGQIDPTTGRVYRLRARDTKLARPTDMNDVSIDTLIDSLGADTRWRRRVALRQIVERGGGDAVVKLREAFDTTGPRALGALWALHQLGRFDDDLAARALRHGDAQVRVWAVRLVGDGADAQAGVASPLAARMAEMARREGDGQVRSQLACTARRLPADQALPIVAGLLTRDEDTDDPHIPQLVWWAIESKCDADRDAVVAMLTNDDTLWSHAMVLNHAAERMVRRLASTGTRRDLLAFATLLRAAPQGPARAAMMKGFEQAYVGRSLATLPDELVDAIDAAGGGSLELRVRRGDSEAIDEALRLLADATVDVEQRRRLAEVFGQVVEPRSVAVLMKLATSRGDASLRTAAMAALQRYDDTRIGAAVLEVYGELPESLKTAAHVLLSARPAWALQWADAIDAGRVSISPDEVAPEIVEQLRLHAEREPRLAAWVDKRFGASRGTVTDEATRREIERLTKVLDAGAGDPYDGLALFNARCAACHKLFDKGGAIGPDLTPHPRRDTGAMLLAIVNPSVEVREGYEGFVAVTKDGRTVSGFMTDRDERVVSLRGLDGQTVTLRRDEISHMQSLGRSIMPDGLLSTMTDQQVRDLFAYLRQAQPLSR